LVDLLRAGLRWCLFYHGRTSSRGYLSGHDCYTYEYCATSSDTYAESYQSYLQLRL